MRHTIRLVACLLTLVLAASGCSDLAEPQFSPVAGVYTLDASGPIELRIDPRSQTVYTVTSGVLELQPTWYFAITFQGPESGASLAGNYTHSDGRIILDYPGGESDTGTFNGDRLTLTRSDGVTVIFRKVPEA